MKLSDVVSNLHLTIYAELPLLLFLGIFIGVAVHLRGGQKHFEEMRQLPVERRKSDGDQYL